MRPIDRSQAVLCVTLNAALDMTYAVEGVRWHAANRVTSVKQRGGGKGVNVARVLRLLGQEAVVTGFIAGEAGELIRRDLASSDMDDEFLVTQGESRRTLTVVDTFAGDATGFWEAGPFIGPEDWARFLSHYERLLSRGFACVVLSGSRPPGVSHDAYAQLVASARGAGVPVLLDADGEGLRRGAAAGPAVVKPNAEELRDATDTDDIVSGAQRLLQAGADAVVVSAGADGLLALTSAGRWAAKPPERLQGNPTGAGDACVAALARGFVTRASWPERLGDAVALSASAVLRPLAGDVDVPAYHRFRESVRVEEI